MAPGRGPGQQRSLRSAENPGGDALGDTLPPGWQVLVPLAIPAARTG